MPQLYLITVPGLATSDWRTIHDRLLDDFPRVTDVLPTTMKATVLIAYEGAAEVDAWLDSVTDSIFARRRTVRTRHCAART